VGEIEVPATSDTGKSSNPYVGPRPFARSDKYRFFGRDRETSDLYSLVAAHRTVLLYARSGAGKTSLLNAGLLPMLEEGGFDVLPVARVSRFRGGPTPEEGINVYALSAALAWAPGGAAGPGTDLSTASLADVLKHRPRRQGCEGTPRARVLVVDQFEELFTAYPERWRDRRGFFEQLDDAMSTDPSTRVLFAMREDFVAYIDPYEDLLPEECRTRYRLEQLREDAAFAAVERPLEQTTIRFDPGVAKQMVDDLLGGPSTSVDHASPEATAVSLGEPLARVAGEFVAPVQLQVVCFSLFRSLPEGATKITKEHRAVFGSVDQALREFYQGALKEAASKAAIDEDSLRQWFEGKLITEAGTRGLIFRGKATTGGIPNAAVDALEELQIIRAEVRGKDRWYELSHDRFVGPILGANDAWRVRVRENEGRRLVEEERAKAAKEKLIEQAKQAHIFRRLSVALGTMLLLALAAIWFAFWQRRLALQSEDRATRVGDEARRESARAESETAIATDAAKVAQVSELKAKEAQKRAEEDRTRALLSEAVANLHDLVVSSMLSQDADPEMSVLIAAQAVAATWPWDHTVDPEAQQRLHDAILASHVRLTLSGHRDAVWSAAWSPDGQRLATASADYTAKIWDAGTGKELLTLTGDGGPVFSVAWSPDGKRLATASADHTAKIRDAGTGKVLLTLSGHGDRVNSVAWSPDGHRLATASADNTAKVWDAGTGKELLTFSGHSKFVQSVAWSPDGRRLATGSWDHTAKVWDAATGKELSSLSGNNQPVISVAWSPDARQVATGGGDNTATVWDAESGHRLQSLVGHTGYVTSVAWSPDGRQIATGSNDNTAKVWDAGTGKELVTLSGHGNRVWSVAWSPDGQRLATGSADRTAKVWDAGTSKELLTLSGHPGPFDSVAWSPDGQRLATGSADNTAKVWNARTGKELLTLSSHGGVAMSVAWSPDGRRLATGSADNTANVWDSRTGEKLLTLGGHGDVVMSLAWSPDGTRLATGGRDNTAKIWDARTGKELLTLSGHPDAVVSVAWSPDDRHLATASLDHSTRVWNVAGGEDLLTLSRKALSTAVDQELLTLSGNNVAYGVAWSPDGKRLATAGYDKRTRVWDPTIGKELLTLTGHSGPVYSVAWSPDGKRLATGSQDYTARVWDEETGKQLLNLSGHSGPVYSVAWSPDGKRLATASEDGTVQVYAMDIHDLMALARQRVTAHPSEEGCKKYLHVDKCPPVPELSP
jgi:WD40 repeat protein